MPPRAVFVIEVCLFALGDRSAWLKSFPAISNSITSRQAQCSTRIFPPHQYCVTALRQGSFAAPHFSHTSSDGRSVRGGAGAGRMPKDGSSSVGGSCGSDLREQCAMAQWPPDVRSSRVSPSGPTAGLLRLR